MSFTPYGKYKDAGVQWLQNVPAHWCVVTFKRLVEIQNGADHKSVEQPEGYPVFGSGGRFAYASAYLYDGESILLGRKGTIDRPIHVKERFWTVDTMYWSKIRDGVSGRYAYYAATTIPFSYYSTNTALPSMTQESLNGHVVALPPFEEQVAIAAFLDGEIAKSDVLVAEQERLIVLLKEKRQAVISHAVTKGLNPDAPMKQSGSRSIGTVPAHWDVIKMKWVATMDSGHTPDKKVPAYWDGDIAWVSLNDTTYLKDHDYISDTAYRITPLGMANSSAHLLPERAVVFSRDATIGRCAITTRPMAVSQHFIAWICGESLFPEYLLLRLRSMNAELESLTTGATLKTIGMPEVRTLITPLPPVDEQRTIVEHVQTEVGRIDGLTAQAERAIVLMNERRSALISAAVTGQIDVRAAAERPAA